MFFVTDPDGVIQGVVDIFDIEKVSVKQARQSGRTGREGERTDLMQDRIETIIKPASFIAQDTLIRDALHWIVHLNYRYLPVVDGENRLRCVQRERRDQGRSFGRLRRALGREKYRRRRDRGPLRNSAVLRDRRREAAFDQRRNVRNRKNR